jgi:NAD(P)-dependent dehydrogenase (short-subunit alcohol dehydrogenase family)
MSLYPMYPYYGWYAQLKWKPMAFPPQHQDQHPGLEYVMVPRPISEDPRYVGSGKLLDKAAVITGGDSGIGRAVAIAFAKEGADVAIVYLYEDRDALETKALVERFGRRCLLIRGDLKEESFSKAIVERTLTEYGRMDVLVNNAAVQYYSESIMDITTEQMKTTFETNIYPLFYLTKAALPHMGPGSAIINTASIVAYKGHEYLIDYSATKGAVLTFTRSMAKSLADRGIRVNAVAPGPIWTPLIPSSFPADKVATFGTDTEMRRAGQPFELAPAYVYLASNDSSYVTGETVHVNGGDMVTA